MRSLWDTINEIREKPEEIRRRYMFGYVSVTMLLIVGIWFISVQESFRLVVETNSLRDVTSGASKMLPGSPGTQSLTELFEKGEQLEAGVAPVPAEDFFESEIRMKHQKNETKTMPEVR